MPYLPFPDDPGEGFIDSSDVEAASALDPSLTPEMANIAAVLGGVLRHPGAVEGDPQVVACGFAVVEVLAEDPGSRGMLLREIAQQLSGRWNADIVARAVERLVKAGTLKRSRKGEPRVQGTIQASLYLALLPMLQSLAGHRQLLEMFDNLRARLADGAGDEELLTGLTTLRRRIALYCQDADRVYRDGTTEDLLVHTELDEGELTRRFRMLSELAASRPGLETALSALNGTVMRYVLVVQRLLSRLLADGLGWASRRLVSADEYRRAARYASAEQLAAVFDGVLFDQPPALLHPAAIAHAVEEMTGVGARSRTPEPAARRARRPAAGPEEQWRMVADQLLGGEREVDLLRVLLSAAWSGPAVLTATLAALTRVDRRYVFDRRASVVVTSGVDQTRASVVTPSTLRWRPPDAQSTGDARQAASA